MSSDLPASWTDLEARLAQKDAEAADLRHGRGGSNVYPQCMF